jgi:hypothetical protein
VRDQFYVCDIRYFLGRVQLIHIMITTNKFKCNPVYYFVPTHVMAYLM